MIGIRTAGRTKMMTEKAPRAADCSDRQKNHAWWKSEWLKSSIWTAAAAESRDTETAVIDASETASPLKEGIAFDCRH